MIPQLVDKSNYSSSMRTTDYKLLLWANVSALMIAKYGKENLTRLAADSGVGPGTMTRIKEAQTSVGLDVIEKIATVFGIEPWQLMHPDRAAVVEKQKPDELSSLRGIYCALAPEFRLPAIGAATHAMIPFLQQYTSSGHVLDALDTTPSAKYRVSKVADKTP